MEFVSFLFKTAVPGLGILWLLCEGLQVSYSGSSWSCSCCAALLEGSLGKDVGRMLAVFLLRECLLWVFFSFLLPVHWDSWGSDV